MCGIAGLLSTGHLDTLTLKSHLDLLLSGIRHRGPDDEGCWIQGGVALGMRRLAIIDLAGGRQPMVSQDGRVVLVFNGEIYNFRKLREILSAKGHPFQSRSDSEVILHGYREWGMEVVNHLDGMFAFAIFDREQGKLLLARDHFGIKPLYHISSPDFFAFCSEPAPLLTLPGVTRRLDPQGLSAFLSQKYIPAPRTFIQNLYKLPAASHLTIDTHSPQQPPFPSRYWQLEPTPWQGSDGEALEQLEGLLKQAVQRQLVSDVPVGVFLSGGIDSGLLLWGAKESGEAHVAGAFTVGFGEKSFDESRLAQHSARHLNTPLQIDRLPSPSPADLAGMIAQFGEPFANLSVPANFLVSAAAAKGVKVALNGSGADELFGGYDRYYASHPPLPLALAGSLAPLLLPLASRLPVSGSKHSVVHRARAFLAGQNHQPAQRHAIPIALFSADEIQTMAPDLPPVEMAAAQAYRQALGTDGLQRATWADINTMLPDDYLTLVDRTSMAASLEVRVPFLDLDLARFAFSLASSHKIKGWQKKRILRQLAQRHLPPVIARQPKMGFESPVSSWFRGELGDELAASWPTSPLNDLIDGGFVSRLVQDHQHHRRDAAKQLLALHTLKGWWENTA
ncbi:MAG: asparagine synthase (glutamine-hydrolyzing) [Magnetococcales bacterium]|nr:asparagine synthase (glutamine-hydrolyzing) [Magnetococcales bacterium]